MLAPAKINWTLEVLRHRPDGYHEIRSVLQTIDLCDVVTLSESDDIELVLKGEAGPLADEPPERNLVVRAAEALRVRCGVARGVRIELEKRIPIAAGLGGGSSDAAAVLRGCNVLWETRQDEINLTEIAGEIGSDPPFFVVGGTASMSGRGEIVRPLPDARTTDVLLALPLEHHRGEKTAAMYGALSPARFTEGEATLELEDVVRAGRAVVADELVNVFEGVLATSLPNTARAMSALRDGGITPHLAGSGPAFFLLVRDGVQLDVLSDRVASLGFEPLLVQTLAREAALKIEEL